MKCITVVRIETRKGRIGWDVGRKKKRVREGESDKENKRIIIIQHSCLASGITENGSVYSQPNT